MPPMPIFIDRHDLDGVTAQQVAEAHVADVAIQDDFGVKYHTYWFDPDNGTIFCLAEGPNKEAVEHVHRDSHGLLASSIVELDSLTALNEFMGPVPQHPTGTAYVAPAMRAIVFTDICGSVALTQQFGDDAQMSVVHDHDEIVRRQLPNHGGREVKHTGDGIMASFSSIVAALSFSVDVQRSMAAHNASAALPFSLRVGISVGEPITNDDGDLFGSAVQIAARVCAAAERDEIAVTSGVRELCQGKNFAFVAKGDHQLKGVTEPVAIFAVDWSSTNSPSE
jgi:class 3 adenylate cyclase